MGRSPCCAENGLKKGSWAIEEDQMLIDHIQKHGHGSWRALPILAGLNRCGKSCRLRWTNYLRPDIKRGKFSPEEEQIILKLHLLIGNKWSAIATHLPGRTDNEIKNFWNTNLKKKLIQMGIDPTTHQPRTDFFTTLPDLIALANLGELIKHQPLENETFRLQSEAVPATKLQYFQHIIHSVSAITTGCNPIGGIPNDIEAMALLNYFSQSPLPVSTDIPNIFLPEHQIPFHFEQPMSINTNPDWDYFFFSPVESHKTRTPLVSPHSSLPHPTYPSICCQGDASSSSCFGASTKTLNFCPELMLDEPFSIDFSRFPIGQD